MPCLISDPKPGPWRADIGSDMEIVIQFLSYLISTSVIHKIEATPYLIYKMIYI